MPMGFVFHLSMNEKAIGNFAKLTEEEKEQVLQKARKVSSKEEMRVIVADLSKMG